MKIVTVVLTVGFCLLPLSVFAQMKSSEARPNLTSTSSSQIATDPLPDTPEWQLSLDVIRAKSENLIGKNTKLMAEYNAMEAQHNQLEVSVSDFKIKNEELRKILKEKHGRTDQQMHIDELTQQIKLKEGEFKDLQKRLTLLQDDASALEKKLRLKRLKITETQLNKKAELAKIKIRQVMQEKQEINQDKEFEQLTQALEEERNKEAELDKKWQAIQAKLPKELVLSPEDQEEIKALQKKVDQLTQEKEDLQKQVYGDNSQAKIKQYDQLVLKKKTLEAKIKEFEIQLEQFKNPGALALLSNPRKKETLRQMIEWDTKNNRMRQKIASLREDLVLLRQQVTRLERKLKNSN